MNRTSTTVGVLGVLGVVIGSIGIFTVWAAFAFSCDEGTCDSAFLATTAATAWIGLLIGIIAVVVRTRALAGPWFLQIVAIILAVNLLMTAANLVLAS